MIRRSTCLAIVALLVLSACGARGGTGEPGSLQAMLAMVPDTQANRQYLLYGNLARLRGDDAEADHRALLEASRGSFVVASPLRDVAHDPEGLDRQAGLGLADIDASLETGPPPETLSVFTGRLDRERIDRALTGTATFAQQVRTDERGGIATYSVGESGTMDVRNVSPLRPIGQSLRIGVDDRTMWLTGTDEVFSRALETASGDAPALAEDAAYTEVASLVDEAEAFNVTLLGDPSEFTADAGSILGARATPAQAARAQEQIDAGTLGLAPWLLAGVADAPGELLVTLWHTDDATAQDNAERLRRVVEQGTSAATGEAWSRQLGVTSIEADGAMVVAHLTSDTPIATQLVLNRDTLLMIAE